ncbi:hypothetical protein TWF718_002882 [Orbilia javanica]|uniref:Thioredoxin domain-containing protein n=1 Tax=Orbilia javanica TaxID=47235 RepID=A0AAN8MMB4_9PEZI
MATSSPRFNGLESDPKIKHTERQIHEPVSCALGDISEIKDFHTLTKVTRSPNLVVIGFVAEWCEACTNMKEKVSVLANRWADDDVAFHYVDVDKVPRSKLAYGVRQIPTFLLYRAGVRKRDVVRSDDGLLDTYISQTVNAL